MQYFNNIYLGNLFREETIMTRKTSIPTRPGFRRTYWHVLAWIGWTFLVLGVSAMSLKNRDALQTITAAHFSWEVGAADTEVAQRFGQMVTAPLMASPVAAEPDPGSAAIASYN